jgi:predicted phosphodiesterase
MKNILHISDIHSSTRADRGNSQHNLTRILKGLIQDVKNIAAPDTIFITGDIANSGDTAEYKQFTDFFLMPLLNELGINIDRVAIVPGNHDSNRKAWKQTNSLVRDQLCDKYSSEMIDQQLIEYTNDKYPPFENFHQFKLNLTQIGARNPIKDTFLYYSYEIDGIGIACLNTAWLAHEKDQGRLMIGNHQFDELLKSIKNCKNKIILMHHPLDWLHQEDREKISDKIYKSGISCIFFGHMHKFWISKESRFDQDSVLRIQAGKLDLHEDGTNTGYSLICLNENNNFEDGTINFRHWDNKLEKFNPWVERVIEGKMKFSIKDAAPFNSELFFDICRKKKNKINTDLLCNVGFPENKYKKLTEIFVCPVLTWETTVSEIDASENQKQINIKPEKIDLNTLLSINESLLLLGGENSGKSTLAKRMAIHFLNKQAEGDITQCFFYFDAKEEQISKNSKFKKNLLGFYFDDIDDASCEEKIKRKLTSNSSTILIDSCENLSTYSIKALFDFIRENPDPRYILCSQLSARSDLVEQLNRFENKKFKQLKVEGLKRAHVRELFENWSPSTKGKSFHTVSQAIKSITNAGMPSNPFVYTMLLSIKERKAAVFKSYMHETDLVENFMEIILEKHLLILKNDPQYKDLILFLGYIASLMQKSSGLFLSDSEMALAVSDFNKKISQNFSYDGYLSPLSKCGILKNGNGRYIFSQICFFNFSLAHWHVKLNTSYENLYDEINFIQYDKVFEYISAIKKNDCKLLEFLDQKINLAWKDLSTHEKINSLDSLENEVSRCVSQDLVDLINQSDLDENMNSHSRSQEDADEELDNLSPLQSQPVANKKNDNLDEISPSIYFHELLSLYARVYRAAEHLMNPEISSTHFSNIFGFYMKITSLYVKIFDKKLRPMVTSKFSNLLDYKNLDSNNKKIATDQINAFLNFAISALPNWSVSMMNSDFFNQRQLKRMQDFRADCSSNLERLLITYSLCEFEGIEIAHEITSQKYSKPHESLSLFFKVNDFTNFNFSISQEDKKTLEDFTKKIFKKRRNKSLLSNHIAITKKIWT